MDCYYDLYSKKLESSLHGIIMDRIDEGKIVERWGYWNESVLNDIPGNDGVSEEK